MTAISRSKANPSSPPTGWNSVTLLPHPVPEYHWWNGCSPTAAGMLFAYWDTWMDKSTLYTFHDGNSPAKLPSASLRKKRTKT